MIIFWFVCKPYFFSVLYGANKILRAIVLLFCSNFFQSFECDGNSIPFQLYWSIKGLIFDILWGSFLILLWFNASVTAYLKHSLSLFFGFNIASLCFIQLGESIYDPPFYSNLFHEDYNTISQHFQKQIDSLSFLFLILLNIFFLKIQKVL